MTIGDSFSPGLTWFRSGGQLDRPPLPFETSMPGVFAVGDVRHGSVKRVAGAVGEGSVAIGSVHQYLAELERATYGPSPVGGGPHAWYPLAVVAASRCRGASARPSFRWPRPRPPAGRTRRCGRFRVANNCWLLDDNSRSSVCILCQSLSGSFVRPRESTISGVAPKLVTAPAWTRLCGIPLPSSSHVCKERGLIENDE